MILLVKFSFDKRSHSSLFPSLSLSYDTAETAAIIALMDAVIMCSSSSSTLSWPLSWFFSPLRKLADRARPEGPYTFLLSIISLFFLIGEQLYVRIHWTNFYIFSSVWMWTIWTSSSDSSRFGVLRCGAYGAAMLMRGAAMLLFLVPAIVYDRT